jgi:hypothetical protein
MKIVIRHTADCPNRELAASLVAETLHEAGLEEAEASFELVPDEGTAQRMAFRGSPTILVDGRELFADQDLPIGLACRLYMTPDGPAGVPTVEQIRTEIKSAEQGR